MSGRSSLSDLGPALRAGSRSSLGQLSSASVRVPAALPWRIALRPSEFRTLGVNPPLRRGARLEYFLGGNVGEDT